MIIICDLGELYAHAVTTTPLFAAPQTGNQPL